MEAINNLNLKRIGHIALVILATTIIMYIPFLVFNHFRPYKQETEIILTPEQAQEIVAPIMNQMNNVSKENQDLSRKDIQDAFLKWRYKDSLYNDYLKQQTKRDEEYSHIINNADIDDLLQEWARRYDQ